MSIRLLNLFFVLFLSQSLVAQKDDPVLFSVNDVPVHLSEFKYIYTKTNGQKADFSRVSLQEYLDLYTNFKLKVQKARDMKLDTITSLQQELAGYRRQLADSYLIDREVTDKLVEEAYERTKQDVDISHILFTLAENATPPDTLTAWKQALDARQKLENGESFSSVAMTYSSDKSVNKNQGRIGFVTALFPNGFYKLETAAYNSPTDKVVGPIRTDAGYHLLLVHERRPARGEIEVSHILVRLDQYADMIRPRRVIDSIYAELKAGVPFEDVARKSSQDKLTANKGGYIGFFGINRYEKTFEDAAFALQKDGEFSAPVQSSIGWHIIKRISLKRDEPFPLVKSRLQNQIKQDARFELARKAMIERIKRESDFSENRTTLQQFAASLEQDTAKSFLTYKWKAPEKPSQEALFSFGKDMKTTLGDFADYAQRASRTRQQMAGSSIETVVNRLYTDFIDENALKFEERQLEKKYPDFKSLMREYEEGVLLFEVTKMEVWDKASLDTIGLQAFFDKSPGKYQWNERAMISQYSLVESAKDKTEEVREFSRSNSPEKVLEKFNADGEVILTMQEKTFERGRNEVLDKMNWKSGELSPVESSKRDKSSNFFKIEEVLPPGQKSLQEARGYVVADYQDFLEKKWLEDLKKQYKVKVHEKVFNKLVKK
jgi:peptidyl-prolyl cis-trans isomerase SurA